LKKKKTKKKKQKKKKNWSNGRLEQSRGGADGADREELMFLLHSVGTAANGTL